MGNCERKERMNNPTPEQFSQCADNLKMTVGKGAYSKLTVVTNAIEYLADAAKQAKELETARRALERLAEQWKDGVNSRTAFLDTEDQYDLGIITGERDTLNSCMDELCEVIQALEASTTPPQSRARTASQEEVKDYE
jgi:hypothetical protein